MDVNVISHLHHLFLENNGVSIDTRTISKGDIFFALKGPNFDGNKYASVALEAGARYAVVDNHEIEGVISNLSEFILVDDVLTTLQDLASYHREKSKAEIIAITGSNGKTTTKELLASVLGSENEIIFTKGNLNNHIGVPLTLLTIKATTSIAIVEMGANHIGEIKDLCQIAKPDYGFITNIGKAHLEGFGSLEGVRIGKGELYRDIKERGGRLFVNSNDNVLVELADEFSLTSFYGNEDSFGGIMIDLVEVNNQIHVSFEWKGTPYSEMINLYGAYNYPNILAALNIGYHFGISPPSALQALASYIPKNSRSQIVRTEFNEIYLDAYNANPSSMKEALKAFSKINGKNKIVILGDMFELGTTSEEAHQQIADLASRNFNDVILIGSHFEKTNGIPVRFRSTDLFIQHLSEKPIKGKTILLKGSRSMALERLLEIL